jgi:TRAP-type C4-dicarboxylate transport system substrate-binding protein
MVCAVAEQLDAVATGATPAMMIYTDYYSGKMPLLGMTTNPLFLLNNTWELHQYVEKQNDGRILALLREELAKYGDVHVVGPAYYVLEMIMNSKVPIDSIDKIKGMKFRSGDVPVANALGALGASVTWSPGRRSTQTSHRELSMPVPIAVPPTASPWASTRSPSTGTGRP